MYTIIKEIDLYKEHLEPAWEYSNPDDQWLFAETVNEYVGTEYNVLYVYDDDTYKEVRGLKRVPESVLRISRDDLSYDAMKRRLKKRCFFNVFPRKKKTENNTTSSRKLSLTLSRASALQQAKFYLEYSSFSYSGLIKQLEHENIPHDDAVYAVDNCMANWNEQAFKEAKAYLDSAAFSYLGLIRQLESEGFTPEEAKYGADNCKVNWNRQALKEAKSYLEYSSFSYSGLIKQLENDGYTAEEAKYGVDNCGANWNVQAVKEASSYLETMEFSKQELIAQLESEGFTHEQAVYGVTAIGC